MLANPFTKALWDARRSLLGWTLSITAVAVLYAAFWPSMESPEMRQALESYPQGLLEALNYDDLTTAAGYLGGSVYGLLVPLLVIIFAIAVGTRTVAGDEEAGTLDLLLAHPVSRTSLAVHRLAALVASVALISLAVFLAMVALSAPVGFDGITVTEFAAMTLHLLLLGTVFGTLAFAVGAAMGGRGLTLGVSSAVAVLAYLAASFLPQVEGLEWIENLSPFYWYNGSDPLINGISIPHVMLLAALAAALVTVGVWRFDQRDLAT